MSRRLAAGVLVGLALVLAGCTAAPQRAPKVVQPTVDPPRRTPAVKTALWKFSFQRSEPLVSGDAGPLLYDGRYYARPDPENPLVATILDTRTGKVVVRHQVPRRTGGWQVEDVFLTGGYAIVVDADAEPPYSPEPWYAVTRYRLSDGKATTVATRPPVSTVDPEVVAGDGRYAYVTDQGGRGCVAVADVRQDTASVRYCAPAGWLPGFLRTGDTGLTFAENSEQPAQSRQPTGCRRLVRLPTAGAAAEVPAASACRQYAGAGSGAWSAWTDASDADSDVEHAPVLAAVGTTRSLRVDVGVTGSLRTCGGWVYYNHRADPTTVEIRRWRPSSDVEVIYRSPGEQLSATTSVACADGWLSFMRQDTGTGAGHTDLLAAQLPAAT
jgi:hypothetical protein